MKPIRYAIFDVDGTLADSMHCWQEGAAEYLTARGGGDVVTPTLLRELRSIPIVQGVELLFDRYPDLMKEFSFDSYCELIAHHYITDVSLRRGAKEMLTALRAAGIRMCVVSASFEAALQKLFLRFGLSDYFEFIYTAEHYPKGKNDPAIFRAALDRLSATPAETILFEDSLYSAETAHALGIRIAAIHDKCEPEWEKLRALSEIAFDDGVFTAEKIAEIVN